MGGAGPDHLHTGSRERRPEGKGRDCRRWSPILPAHLPPARFSTTGQAAPGTLSAVTPRSSNYDHRPRRPPTIRADLARHAVAPSRTTRACSRQCTTGSGTAGGITGSLRARPPPSLLPQRRQQRRCGSGACGREVLVATRVASGPVQFQGGTYDGILVEPARGSGRPRLPPPAGRQRHDPAVQRHQPLPRPQPQDRALPHQRLPDERPRRRPKGRGVATTGTRPFPAHAHPPSPRRRPAAEPWTRTYSRWAQPRQRHETARSHRAGEGCLTGR